MKSEDLVAPVVLATYELSMKAVVEVRDYDPDEANKIAETDPNHAWGCGGPETAQWKRRVWEVLTSRPETLQKYVDAVFCEDHVSTRFAHLPLESQQITSSEELFEELVHCPENLAPGKDEYWFPEVFWDVEACVLPISISDIKMERVRSGSERERLLPVLGFSEISKELLEPKWEESGVFWNRLKPVSGCARSEYLITTALHICAESSGPDRGGIRRAALCDLLKGTPDAVETLLEQSMAGLLSDPPQSYSGFMEEALDYRLARAFYLPQRQSSPDWGKRVLAEIFTRAAEQPLHFRMDFIDLLGRYKGNSMIQEFLDLRVETETSIRREGRLIWEPETELVRSE